MKSKSTLVRCEDCGKVTGSKWGPVKRGRFLWLGGRLYGVHLCPGKPMRRRA